MVACPSRRCCFSSLYAFCTASSCGTILRRICGVMEWISSCLKLSKKVSGLAITCGLSKNQCNLDAHVCASDCVVGVVV